MAALRHDAQDASRLLGAAARLRMPLGLSRDDVANFFISDAQATIDASMGSDERLRLEAEGAVLPFDDIVALALETTSHRPGSAPAS
jgi:hypothetical protein